MKRRTMFLWIISFALTVLFAFPFCAQAGKAGSLLLRDLEHPALLYPVADEEGSLTTEFEEGQTDIPLTQMAPQTARQLWEYAQARDLSGIPGKESAQGLFFDGLSHGYYLVGSSAQPGEFAPFLIRIPMEIGGKTVYDIEATPKVEKPQVTPPPVKPDPPKPPKPNIPQTGFVQWPKYLLLIAGGGAILIGFFQILRGRGQGHE